VHFEEEWLAGQFWTAQFKQQEVQHRERKPTKRKSAAHKIVTVQTGSATDDVACRGALG
jgi:hypothetical protein